MHRCKSALAGLVLLALLALGVNLGSLSAEDSTWDTPDARTKDLQLTLNIGEIVRGSFSAETGDKVMLTVLTDKGKILQTIKKDDVKLHDWIPRLEEEVRTKIVAWPADKFETMMAYAQEMTNKGLKNSCADAFRERQQDFTAEQFQIVACFLINNDALPDARALLRWAEKAHADWKEQLEDIHGRLPVEKVAAPKVEKQEVGDVGVAPSAGVWGTGFEKAKELAKESHKPILVLFTGSDWNTDSMKWEREVFGTATFKRWASENVVLLKLDYPRKTYQDPLVKAQNESLQTKYKVKEYPCVILMNEGGKAWTDRTGYVEGGVEKWLKATEAIIAKNTSQ